MSSPLVTVAIILAWYGSNIGVILLNKVLLSQFHFRFPVFLTLCHMLACSATSWAVATSRLVPLQHVKSRAQLAKISLLGLVFSLTVVLGNVSLRFIPVSFNQAIGATTPAFTAALSLLMLGHRESRGTYLSLIPVVVGIVIASGAEPLFHMLGFLAAISATAARAFKSVLQGVLLSDPGERMDSMSLLTYMAPVAVLALIPLTLFYEQGALDVAVELGRSRGFWGLLLLNSFLAYFVNLTNFLVTKHTSALTLQVLGNAKGVVAVVISILYFRNPVNVYSVLGYAITVTGVVLYSQARKAARKQHLLKEMKGGGDVEVAFTSSGSIPIYKQLSLGGSVGSTGSGLLGGQLASLRWDPHLPGGTQHEREHLGPAASGPLLPAAADKLTQTASGRSNLHVDATGRGMGMVAQA